MIPEVGEYYIYQNGDIIKIEKIVDISGNLATYRIINNYQNMGAIFIPLPSQYTKIHPILVKLWRLDEA